MVWPAGDSHAAAHHVRVESANSTMHSQHYDASGPLSGSRGAVHQVKGIRRVVYVALAAICLALGLVGAVLPGLPTTPFLLVMSFLLLRSSPWLHRQVVRMPLVGRHLKDWDEKRGVRRSVKVVAYASVGVAVAIVLVAAVLSMYFKLLILVLALVGVVVIRRLPTIEQPDVATNRPLA